MIFNVGDYVRVQHQDNRASFAVPSGTLGIVVDAAGVDHYQCHFEGYGHYRCSEDELLLFVSLREKTSTTPMTKAGYIAFHAECCSRMQTITAAKNADYTGIGDDPFSNFRLVERFGVCTTEQGLLTRMSDKFSRLASFCQRGELSVKDESVEDTLLDLANYCILTAGYLRSKNGGQNE